MSLWQRLLSRYRKTTSLQNAKHRRSRLLQGIERLEDRRVLDAAPTAIHLSPDSVAEHAPVATVVGTLTTTDEDVGDTFSYSLFDDYGGTFAVSGDQLVVADNSYLDFESQASVYAGVEVTDSYGNTFQTYLDVFVDDVDFNDKAPTDLALSPDAIDEESPAGTVVGTVYASDPDEDDTLTLSLDDDYSGTFALTGDEIVIANNQYLDFEPTGGSVYVGITVTDSYGNEYSEYLYVTINDLDFNDKAPTDLALSSDVIDEESPAGTVVGTVYATDPDEDDTLTLSLYDDYYGTFALTGDEIVIANNQYLDFEASGGSVYVGITVTDAYGNEYSEYLYVTLTDVDFNDKTPTDIAIDSDVVTEHTAIGTVVGTLFGTDPDEDDTLTFSIFDSFHGSFAVEGDSLVVVGNQYLNYEWWGTTAIYVGVTVTDSYGNYYQEYVDLTLLDSAEEGPTDVYLANDAVYENAAVGTVVGELQTSDEDSTTGFVYELVAGTGSADNSHFAIAGSELTIQSVFDYETKNTYSVRVRVTDPTGLATEKPLTVYVYNEGESPTDIGLAPSSVDENLNPGATVGTLSTTDQDIGDYFDYQLVSGAGSTNNSAFTIASGGILKAAIKFNYEVKNSYSVRVRATDAYGLNFERILVINVNNVNEAPTAVSLSASAVDENRPSAAVVGNFSTTDPDAGDTFSYALVAGSGDADNAAFQIVGGELHTAISFDYETQNSYSIRVQAADAAGLTHTRTFTITINDVNDAPVLDKSQSPTLDSVAEDAANPAGTLVSSILSGVSDADAGAVKGVAVTGLTSSGTWQYQLSGSGDWVTMSSVSENTAVALRPEDKVRLLPKANFSGTALLYFRGWDQTDGQTAGSIVNVVGATGGTNAYSSNWDTAALSVAPVNDAPVLNKNLSPTLDSVAEDATNSAGTLVSSILAGVSDADAGAVKGIAVTGLTSSGAWQYQLSGSSDWVTMSSVSEATAILLRPEDKVRLLPKANFNGTAQLYFRAWDQSDGLTPGSVANLIGATGGTSAYSSNWDTAALSVTPVNDAPVLNKNLSAVLDSVAEDAANPAGTLVSSLLAGVSDVDAGAVKGIAVTGLTSSGTWQYQLSGSGDWVTMSSVSETTAVVLRPADKVRLLPKTNFNGTAQLYFRGWDQTDGQTPGSIVNVLGATGGTNAYSSNWDTAALSVTPVNDAPVLNKNLSPTLDSVTANDTDPAGSLVSSILAGVSDTDAGAVKGIVVTGLTSSGTWQYQLSGSSDWVTMSSVSEATAVVLRPEDKVRLIPKPNFHGTALLYFRGWDQTDGQAAGSIVNVVGATGGVNAYSSNWDTAALSVTQEVFDI
jgi:hypothetical protein